MRRRARAVEGGLEFHFFYSKRSPSELHITAEHGTMPDDVIATYFDGVTEYDVARRRFVTVSAEHTLFWNWIDESRSLYVITCIRAGE